MAENLVELAMSRVADSHPLVAEIVEALVKLSGEAHRDLVIGRIAQGRHPGAHTANAALRDEILRAFHAHCETGVDRALFRLRFGEGSHRWSVTPAAMAFLAARGEMC